MALNAQRNPSVQQPPQSQDGRRTTLLKWAALVASLLFTLATAEVVCRIFRPENSAEIATTEILPSGRKIVTLKPGSSGMRVGKLVTVNTEGYRGRLRSREKPRGTTRVLVFGDSHTFGVGADDQGTYPAQLENRLDAMSESRVEVLNFGVGGQDLESILTRARRRAFDYHPDLVLITFHQGDLLESGDLIIEAGGQPSKTTTGTTGAAQRPGALHLLKTTMLANSALAQLVVPRIIGIARNISDVSSQGVTAAETREILQNGPAWRAAEEKLLYFERLCDRSGVRLGLILFPSMMPFDSHPAKKLHSEIQKRLEPKGIAVLDLLPCFEGHDASTLIVSIFDGHPNESGYGIAASCVASTWGDSLTRAAEDDSGGKPTPSVSPS